MTVTGNVALAASSSTLLEFSPTVSDKLLISGTLSIATGATLTLTGNRPLTPGAGLDLVVAGGGISGNFTTINKPASIFGFLRQSADRIQLLGTFDDGGFNPQIGAAIRYTNALLTSGQASNALIAAIPSLLATGGTANGTAFARLTPEPYASAKQITVEHGLALAQAARTVAATSPVDRPGAFTFAQALGAWRNLGGSGAIGTSATNVRARGILGGFGYGRGAVSLGGFGGYLDSRQHVGALGARTDSRGAVAGGTGRIALGSFEATALVAYDFGKARTIRTTPGTGTARSRYRLRGWTADASLVYGIDLGAGVAIKPQAGLTYVGVRRGAAAESGAGAFVLTIAAQHDDALFVDGSLAVLGARRPERPSTLGSRSACATS